MLVPDGLGQTALVPAGHGVAVLLKIYAHCPADRDAEGGRGLQFVAGLAARWGWRRRRGGRLVTWFEIQALLQPMQHSAVSGKGLNSPDVDVPGS